MTQPRASARLFGAAALVLVSLTVCFLFTSVGAAQEQRETKPLALILVVDTSGSMEPLFEGVKESAKGIIDDCHIDDRVVLITFDDRHRGYPP